MQQEVPAHIAVAQVGEYDTVAIEAGIQAAIGIVAYNNETITLWVVCITSNHNLTVRLDGDGLSSVGFG